MNTTKIVILSAAFIFLTSCGQTGPLYLPAHSVNPDDVAEQALQNPK